MPTHRSTVCSATSAAALLVLFSAAAPPAHADIFQWEYLDPAIPHLGIRQSTTLAPGGAGVDAVPDADLSFRDLTKAHLLSADLTGALARSTNLTDADLTHANLSDANLTNANLANANFTYATLLGANLTGADVRRATFTRDVGYNPDGGISLAQLYSTASYQARDLTGIRLTGNEMTGADFTGQNLTDAYLIFPSTGVIFTDAEVRGAVFEGITKAQLYATASYKAKDLTGITLNSTQTDWSFAGANLTDVEFQRVNLGRSDFRNANLTNALAAYATINNAHFRGANLAGADLSFSTLTGADLTGADVRGASFSADGYFYPGSGLTISQLRSTASFQARDLRGINLRGNDLSDANLAGQDFTDANFTMADLGGADLTGARVRGANFARDPVRAVGGVSLSQLYSTASYQSGDLRGLGLAFNHLAGVKLEGRDLANANFVFATLTDADFRGANLAGARFGEGDYGADLSGADLSRANLTNASLVNSTLANARLVRANLTGAALTLATLTNADLRQADLTGADLSGYFVVWSGEEGGYHHFPGANLSGADLSGADLTDANFSGTEDYVFGFPHPGANFTNADLSGADARGANTQYATMTGANTTNLIQPNGHIAGLGLTSGASLTVRDYDGDGAAIVVEEHMTTDTTGSLRLVFDADSWNSTISFAPGIPVARDGTLELTFAPGVNPVAQRGRTFDLFDWTGVAPTGTFDVESLHLWDLSDLYTTGDVTLLALVGDANADGRVNADDYFRIDAAFLARAASPAWHDGDFNADGRIDADDYFLIDQAFLGQSAPLAAALGTSSPPTSIPIPEPVSSSFLLLPLLLARRRTRRSRHPLAVLAPGHDASVLT